MDPNTALGFLLLVFAIGITGSTPLLAFESTENYVGQKGDGNREIWKALVD